MFCGLFFMLAGGAHAESSADGAKERKDDGDKVTIIRQQKGDKIHNIIIRHREPEDGEEQSVTVKSTTTVNEKKTGIVRRLLNRGMPP
jgi:hypothetical protein